MMRKRSALLGSAVYLVLSTPLLADDGAAQYLGTYYMDPTAEIRTTAISGAHFAPGATSAEGTLYVTSADAGAGYFGTMDDWWMTGLATHQDPRYIAIPFSRSLLEGTPGKPFYKEVPEAPLSKVVRLEYGREPISVDQKLTDGHVSPRAVTVFPSGEVAVLSEGSERTMPFSVELADVSSYIGWKYDSAKVNETGDWKRNRGLVQAVRKAMGQGVWAFVIFGGELAKQIIRQVHDGVHVPAYGYVPRVLVTGSEPSDAIDNTGTRGALDKTPEGRLMASFKFPEHYNNDNYGIISTKGISPGKGIESFDVVPVPSDKTWKEGMDIECLSITGSALVQDRKVWAKAGETPYSRLSATMVNKLWVERPVVKRQIDWIDEYKASTQETIVEVQEKGFDYRGTMKPLREVFYGFSRLANTQNITVRGRSVTDIAAIDRDFALILETSVIKEPSQNPYYITRVVAVNLRSGSDIESAYLTKEEMSHSEPMKSKVVINLGKEAAGSMSKELFDNTGTKPSSMRFESLAVTRADDQSYRVILIPKNGYTLSDRMYVHTFQLPANITDSLEEE